MSEAITVALIAALGGIIVQIIIAGASSRAQKAEAAKKEQKIDDRLSNIDEKLDEHNGYAQKFAEVAQSMGEIKTDIAVIKVKMEYIAKEEDR